MGRARNLANLLEADGDVKSDALDNVQSPLTAGTDYQTPLTAGTDYQTPLTAGTDYQTPLTAGTDYQTPLTAGTDYLAPDGDGSGLSGIASDALKKSIALATGGSVTAAKAVGIDSDGKTGLYPDLNILSSAQAHTSATGNGTVSGNGRVSMRVVTTNNGNSGTFTIYGTALKDDGTSSESSTTVSFSTSTSNGDNYENTSVRATYYLHDNYFAILGYTRARSGSTAYYNCKMCTVSINETTGVPTKIQEVTLRSGSATHNNGTNYNTYFTPHIVGSADYAAPNAGSSKEWHVTGYVQVHGTPSKYYPFSSEINSTGSIQNTTLSDSYLDGVQFGSKGSSTHFPSANLDVQYYRSGSSWYYQTRTYTAYNSIGTTRSSATSFLSDVDTGISAVFDDSILVIFYRKVTGEYFLKSYSINSSTGVPTLVGSLELSISSSVELDAYNLQFKSATEFYFSYRQNGGLYFVNTAELDSNKDIIGTNFPVSLGTLSANIRYDDSNTEYRILNFDSNYIDYDLTSTSASTSAFKYGGIANATASSGSVDVVVAGVASGFTGLSPSSNYYIDPSYDGSVSTNTETGIFVGRAISATELLVSVTSA